MYTSGTTGAPKGAVLTHANMIVQNVLMHGTEWGIGRDDRYLVVTPLAHRAGVSRLFNALGLGGTLVILDKFDPAADDRRRSSASASRSPGSCRRRSACCCPS